MKNSKKISKILSVFLLGTLLLQNGAMAAQITDNKRIKETELYEGVVHTYAKTVKGVYGYSSINVLEIDLSNKNLHIDVVGGGEYANQCDSVAETCEKFDKADNGKTVIAAVNGDLWMMESAHSRYDMSIVTKGYEGDGVVCKKSMTIPRGFNVYDGEIITTAHMTTELPFEGPFQSFGITNDYEAIMGTPRAVVKLKDANGGLVTNVSGVNRLPANNSVVLYSDKVMNTGDFTLDESYDVLFETEGDYSISHGQTIKATVKAIYDKNTSENAPKLAENQFMLAARGNKVENISELKVGQKVTMTVEIKADKDVKKWQNVKTAVGGHIQVVKEGKITGENAGNGYPTTLVGSTKDDKFVLVTVDGRQKAFSEGTNATKLAQLVKDLDLYNAFLVDGGGSTTMVIKDEAGEYDVVNSPSDSGNKARDVVNSIIISYGPERTYYKEQSETTTEAPATSAPATDAPATDAPSTDAPATSAPATDAPSTDGASADTSAADTGMTDDTDPATDAVIPGTEDTVIPGTSEGTSANTQDDPDDGSSPSTGIIIAVVAVIILAAAGGATFFFIKKKKA